MQQYPVIELRGIVNRFGKQTVHDGVDLTIYENEIIGLVGGSGSGKSVLLQTILGLRQPQAGTVSVFGKSITGLHEQEMLQIQRNWGVLFQSGALFSSLTVLDNILLPLREHIAMPEDDRQELARIKLALVGLPQEAGIKYPSELSGGMIKRASLARALALDPSILFLDEPTAGLDPISASEFDQLLRSLQKTLRLSVLMITHDLDSLVAVCDRIAVLIEKKLTIGTLEAIMNHPHPWIRSYFHGDRMRQALAAPHATEAQHG